MRRDADGASGRRGCAADQSRSASRLIAVAHVHVIQTRSPVDAAVHLAAPLVTGLEVLARVGYLLDPMTDRPTDFRISVLALALFPVLYAAIVVVALVCRCWLD